MTRFLRRHRTALIALAVYNFVFFFPVAFMGRVVSPNDVFLNFSHEGSSLTARVDPSVDVKVGQEIALYPDPRQAHLFDHASGRRLH